MRKQGYVWQVIYKFVKTYTLFYHEGKQSL